MSNIFQLNKGTTGALPRVSTEELNLRITQDSQVVSELNTYRNWGAFGLPPECRDLRDDEQRKANAAIPAESFINPYFDDNKMEGLGYNSVLGTKSLFNPVNAVKFNTSVQIENNAPLLDTPEMREKLRRRGDCSIKELCRASANNEMGRQIYNYSDFMFCKHLGRVSNNYLVTLRRFPFPCGDHINFIDPDDDTLKQFNAHMPDTGRLITWIGTPGNDMANILKYSVLMPYDELTAGLQEVTGTAESGGLMGSLLNLSSASYINSAFNGTAGSSTLSLLNKGLKSVPFGNSGVGKALDWASSSSPPQEDWKYHIDETKTYGNADVITKTHKRRDADKGGLEFNQEISLVFEYELRSYDGINGKAAFLDLIGNILAVTYTNGKFWGGAYRGSGQSQTNIFTNLPIYKLMNSNKGEAPSWSSIVNASVDSISQVGESFGIKKGGGIGGVIDAIKNIASNIGKMLFTGALNALGRPQKQGLNSLLNPAPVGLWHLTIGNPKHPIMSMGNMILTGVDIEHYGPLGMDDFPTGLKVEIKLKHAKPRDAMEIENMYYMGDYRIYQPMGKHIENMYNAAVAYKDRSNQDKQNNKQHVGMADDLESTGTKNDSTVPTTEEVAKADESTNKLYMKFFGTEDRKNVDWASREAHLGSQKAKTQEEADAEQAEAKRKIDEQKKREESARK